MTDISNIARMVDGLPRNMTLTDKTLVMTSIKIGASSPTELTKTILDNLIVQATEVPHLVTLSGVVSGSDSLGSFTGATIADDQTIKAALQALETAHEVTDGKTGHLITLSGVAASADSLGSFTGSTIADSQTIKAALQALETAVEGNATADALISTKVGNLITLSGVAANETHQGSFTGATIPSSSTDHDAFQALETAVELRALDSVVTKKDGTVAFTGNQSMGTHKLTNLVAGDADTDAANYKQLVDGLALKVAKAGDTMTGFLILHADPTNVLGAVTKQYADAIAGGFNPHAAVVCATIAALPACTPSGAGVGKSLTATSIGVLTLDTTITPAQYDRILVKNQVDPKDNGIYTLTTVNNASTAFILVRATDSDGAPSYEVQPGDFVLVSGGHTLGGSQWAIVAGTAITVDTSDIVWGQIAVPNTAQAGIALSAEGTVFNVNTDGSTIEVSGGNALIVKSGGITATQLGSQAVTAAKLHADVAGAGLAGGNGTNLSVNAGGGLEVDTDIVRLAASVAGEALGLTLGVLDVKTDNSTIEVNTDALRIKTGGVGATQLGGLSVTAAKLGSDVAGAGMTGGNGSALAIDFATSGNKAITATNLAANTTGLGASLIGIFDTANHFGATNVETALAEIATTVEGLSVAGTAIDLTFTNNTGSTIPVGSVIILSKTVAGEMIPAKADAIATCEGVVGVVIATVLDTASGKVRIHGEVTVATDAALDIGKRAYVSSVNAGQVTKTAPSATNSVVYLIGIASSTTKIVLQAHLEAINE